MNQSALDDKTAAFRRAPLRDGFGREFSYLRLSVTTACNFRCVYCLPRGAVGAAGRAEDKAGDLSIPEIRNLVSAFAGLGITKVRLTGGEPTVRGDIVDLIHTVASVPGIDTVGLTTNGYGLRALAPAFKAAGLRALNVSLDSLSVDRFKKITGVAKLKSILDGIEMASKVGFDSMKLNVVLLKDLSKSEFLRFVALTQEENISVRFIELMQTKANGPFFANNHMSYETVKQWLAQMEWRERRRSPNAGPALEFVRPGFAGSVGIIAPYSKDFCANCNRLRVTSQGKLRLCLFGDHDFLLREYLVSPARKQELQSVIRALLSRKLVSHFLADGRFGNTDNLASIGG